MNDWYFNIAAKVLLWGGDVVGLDAGDEKLDWEFGCMYSGGKILMAGFLALGKALALPRC